LLQQTRERRLGIVVRFEVFAGGILPLVSKEQKLFLVKKIKKGDK